MIKALAITAGIGATIGGGISAVTTRNSDGERAGDVAKGLGIAAGVTTGLGIAGAAFVSAGAKKGIGEELMRMVFIGLPSIGAVGIGAGLGGAAVGAALVAASRD